LDHPHRTTSGANEKIQEKDVSDALVRESNQHLERDLGRDADRVFIDPFRRDPDALIDPFGNSEHMLLLLLRMLSELRLDRLAGDAGRGNCVHRVSQDTYDLGCKNGL